MSEPITKPRVSAAAKIALVLAAAAVLLAVFALAAPGSRFFFPLVSLWCSLALFACVLLVLRVAGIEFDLFHKAVLVGLWAAALGVWVGAAEAPYLVIDLSSGPSSGYYPYRSSETGPELSGERCRTEELWLRRVPAGRFRMGSAPDEPGRFVDEGLHEVSVESGFLLGVFEVTRRQYELVMGSNPSYFSNTVYAASRPVENVTMYYELLGDNFNVQRTPAKIKADSLFGRLRARTGLPLTLPSYMQSEWACRAGDYGGEYYRYKVDGVELAADVCARYYENSNVSSATGDSDRGAGFVRKGVTARIEGSIEGRKDASAGVRLVDG